MDESSTDPGTNIDSQKIQSLPSGRNYTSIVQIAPGVSTQTSNTEAFANAITVYGSTGLENSFVIDGVLTSGVEYGAQGKELNYEFVQELDVKTGGYQAEYGRSTGGIINVITKSGGNQFHGEAFVYYDNDSLQANNKHKNETLYGTFEGFNRLDFGASLGGYFVKDHLWFFGAYDRVQNTTKQTISQPGPNFGEPADTDSTRDLASAKLTWMITPSHSLVGSFFQDPRDDVGAVNDGAHPLERAARDLRGHAGLRRPGLQPALQRPLRLELRSRGPGRDPPGRELRPAGTRRRRDPVHRPEQQPGPNRRIRPDPGEEASSATWARSPARRYLGNHEIKGGVEYLEDEADVIKRESGGQLVTILNIEGYNGPPVYQHFYWTIPTAALPDNVPTDQLNATPYHRTYSFYLQDSWSVLPNLTVNAGMRYDNQQIFSGDGTRQINLTGSWAPRIGFAWDPTNDGKSKVFGSFGYFYEQIPMDLVIRSFSSERQPTIYNFDPTSVVPDLGAAILVGDEAASQFPGTTSACCGGKIFGGFNSLADAGISGQYVREGIVGVEREVAPNFAVGAKFIYRDLPRIIEDYLCADGVNYCIGNPTEEGMETLSTLDYNFRFPAPLQKRIYKGFQFDATKRFSDCWSVLASYVYSTLQGNYDGLFAPYTQPRGTADPNISALYDYYDFFTAGPVRDGVAQPFTANGYLSNDRRHQVKASGVYTTPFNLVGGGGGLLPHGHADLPHRAVGRLRTLRVLPAAARLGGPSPRRLRGGPAPRLSAPAGSRDPDHPGRRVQRPEPAAGHRRGPEVQRRRIQRPQSGLSDGEQRQRVQRVLRDRDRAHVADHGALRVEAGVLSAGRGLGGRGPAGSTAAEEVAQRGGDGARPLHGRQVPGGRDRDQSRARNRGGHGLGVGRRRQRVAIAHHDERRNGDPRELIAPVRPVAHRGQIRLDGLGRLALHDPRHALDQVPVLQRHGREQAGEHRLGDRGNAGGTHGRDRFVPLGLSGVVVGRGPGVDQRHRLQALGPPLQ